MCCVLARLSTVALLGFLLVAVSPGDVLAQAAKDPAKPAPPAQAAPVPAAKKDGATKAAPTPTAQAPAAGNPPIPPNVQLTLLIQNAMAAVSQANMTGNYTVLHALAAPSFQQVNPPEKLNQIFAGLRSNNIDISPVIVHRPILTTTPAIDDKGLLRLTGYYGTKPQNVMFDMLYVPFNGQWRLHGIAIQTRAAV